jgi:Zn-dependent peptidase ImmA (M78 family)
MAAEALDQDVDAFLDPFRLVGEGDFNFRVEPEANEADIESFAGRAGTWIATYRELCARAGISPKLMSQRLELREDSTFEQAQAAAEALWNRWELGDVPADRLEEAITRQLDVLVLYVDAPRGISGAASQLPGLQTILVNRRETLGRRMYDLAHELFHVLTWDAMPPKRVEPYEVKTSKGNRVEQLANNFAAALLMPAPIMNLRWGRKGEGAFEEWVLLTANALRVSTKALQWRLVTLKMLSKGAIRDLMSEVSVLDVLPPLFSSAFVERVHDAVEAGFLSLRKAASLLDLSLSAFSELCRSHGRPLSYDVHVPA